MKAILDTMRTEQELAVWRAAERLFEDYGQADAIRRTREMVGRGITVHEADNLIHHIGVVAEERGPAKAFDNANDEATWTAGTAHLREDQS